MQATELISALQTKLKTSSQRELAYILGITEQTLISWKNNNITLTANQVANALSKARNAAVRESQHYMIQPIVEFYPIEKKLSKGGVNWEVLDTNPQQNKYNNGVRSELLESYGIYIFYDSTGKSLYVGKAREQNLWKEINNAFNRERDVQNIALTKHPKSNKEFKAGYEKLRSIKDSNLKLHDMAYYFSAYHIDDGFINNLEALLIRAFANDLMNVKMESFTNTK